MIKDVFIQQMCIEHLVCARHCSLAVNKTDKNICPHGTYILVVAVVMKMMMSPNILSPYYRPGFVVSALYVSAHVYAVM